MEDRVLATPITPEALPFDPGEKMVVATTKAGFELGLYVWTNGGLGVWSGKEWEPRALALDKHLTIKPSAV